MITPQPETAFTVMKGDLSNFKRFKNLIFIAMLEDSGTVANIVKSNLSPENKTRIEDGSYLFIKKERWAKNQLIMFLVSTNTELLKQKINENKNYLYNLYNEHWYEVQKKALFNITGEYS